VIVPSCRDVAAPPPLALVDAVRAASPRGHLPGRGRRHSASAFCRDPTTHKDHGRIRSYRDALASLATWFSGGARRSPRRKRRKRTRQVQPCSRAHAISSSSTAVLSVFGRSKLRHRGAGGLLCNWNVAVYMLGDFIDGPNGP